MVLDRFREFLRWFYVVLDCFSLFLTLVITAVMYHWSLQLLLSVCTWEREHEEDNFICTKYKHLRNTKWWRHYLSIPPSSMSPLITIFRYPLPLPGDFLYVWPLTYVAKYLLPVNFSKVVLSRILQIKFTFDTQLECLLWWYKSSIET